MLCVLKRLLSGLDYSTDFLTWHWGEMGILKQSQAFEVEEFKTLLSKSCVVSFWLVLHRGVMGDYIEFYTLKANRSRKPPLQMKVCFSLWALAVSPFWRIFWGQQTDIWDKILILGTLSCRLYLSTSTIQRTIKRTNSVQDETPYDRSAVASFVRW